MKRLDRLQEEVKDLTSRLQRLELGFDRLTRGQFVCCFIDTVMVHVFRGRKEQVLAENGFLFAHLLELPQIDTLSMTNDEKKRWIDVKTNLPFKQLVHANNFLKSLKAESVPDGPLGESISRQDLEDMPPVKFQHEWKKVIEVYCSSRADSDMLYDFMSTSK